MIHAVKQRAVRSLEELTASANGRELQMAVPQWHLPNGKTEPLSREERGLAVRWQFFSNCTDSIDALWSKASEAAHEAFAAAHLRVDDEIGPVLIVAGPQETRVIFSDATPRALTPAEKAGVDRYLDAFEAYRLAVQQRR
jgi:hypothetical protein